MRDTSCHLRQHGDDEGTLAVSHAQRAYRWIEAATGIPVEMVLICVSVVSGWIVFMYHMRQIRSFGVLVIVVERIFIKDVFMFMMIYAMFTISFAQAVCPAQPHAAHSTCHS